MTFANLSPLAVASGLAALAAILYGLQRLRIRFREQPVATLLFWKAASTEAPARTLVQRFRHLWAYLLILSICSLIWLAIAEPQWQDEAAGDDFYVLLLDGSAGMAREGRFDAVLADLQSDLGTLPPEQRQVIWSGARAETLLLPGEQPLLLQQRLAGKRPEAVPSSIERQLAQLAAVRRDEFTTQIRLYGDAPVSAALLDSLPEGVSVVQGSGGAGSRKGNAGITALGVEQASSGRWEFVDLLLRVEGDERYLPAAGDIDVNIDGTPLPPDVLFADAPNETGGRIFRAFDLPAEGGLLSVTFGPQDALPLDNRVELRLPRQQTIKVQLSENLPAVMATVLRADTAIELVDSNPDVVIRNQGELLGGEVAALEFVDIELQTAAFVLGYPEHAGASDAGTLLQNALQQIGLDNIDATGLAEAAQRPVEVAMRPDDEWSFSLWRELLSEDYNFVQSRSFPLFIAQSVRWLAGVQKWYPYLAAGRPLPAPSIGGAPVFVDAGGTPLDTVGVDYVPAAAGTLHRAGDEAPLAVALLDRVTTVGAPASALKRDGLGTFAVEAARNGLLWLLLLALAGLLAEWWLYQRGRMP